MTSPGDASVGPHAHPGQDAAAIVHLFACLACADDERAPQQAQPGGPAGERYRQGVAHGRRVEQELVARLAAMAAGRRRTPVHIPYDPVRAADADYRRGMAAGRRIVHESVLVSHRMITGEACPVCAGTGTSGHHDACRYA
ncbi:hypothetical protein [Catellatospora sp. NPDC049609]|uniref:hypothetical protein n=1 Tax=Catellatospora sp. NPDC049609 TaxID=3155505 RepID=UPI00342A9C7A